METLFYVLDTNFNRVGLIDSFVSLMWCKRYYEIGALDLEIEATRENLNLFKKGYYIVREDDDVVFRIEAIEIDTRDDSNNVMSVGAIDVKSILSQRVIVETVYHRGYLQDYIFSILDENLINPKIPSRRITNFTCVRNDSITDTIQQQVSNQIVSDKIIELCRSFLLGWKVSLDNGVFEFSLYKGNDRSGRVVFSQDNDNLLSSKYTYNSTEFKNAILVAGEGEGDARTKVWVGSSAGLDRFEDFVDESISQDNLEDIEYMNELKSKGYEILAERGKTITFEGDVIPESYRYKIDFDLGDIVKIRNELGIETDTRITEVIEIWDEEGYTLEIKFEYLEFQGALPPVELKRELVFTGSPTNLIFTADEYPYGITVEVYGQTGGDGEEGQTGDAEPKGAYWRYYCGLGGNGGTNGRDEKILLNVDGEEFTALARGGAGGGGGAGGWGHYCDEHVEWCAGGAGGKGANGDVITIDIAFTDKVILNDVSTPYNFSFRISGSGSPTSKLLVDTSGASHYEGGYSARYVSSGIQNPSSGINGANAPAPTDSSCTYPAHKINNNNDTTFIGIKVYAWKEVPITI